MLASGLQTERGLFGKMRHFVPCKEWGQPGVMLYSEDCRKGICRQQRTPGGMWAPPHGEGYSRCWGPWEQLLQPSCAVTCRRNAWASSGSQSSCLSLYNHCFPPQPWNCCWLTNKSIIDSGNWDLLCVSHSAKCSMIFYFILTTGPVRQVLPKLQVRKLRLREVWPCPRHTHTVSEGPKCQLDSL